MCARARDGVAGGEGESAGEGEGEGAGTHRTFEPVSITVEEGAEVLSALFVERRDGLGYALAMFSAPDAQGHSSGELRYGEVHATDVSAQETVDSGVATGTLDGLTIVDGGSEVLTTSIGVRIRFAANSWSSVLPPATGGAGAAIAVDNKLFMGGTTSDGTQVCDVQSAPSDGSAWNEVVRGNEKCFAFVAATNGIVDAVFQNIGANGGVDVTSGPEGGALPAPTSLVSGPSSVHDLHVGADGRVLAVVGNKLFDVGHPGASPIDLAAAGAVAAADFVARATSDGDGHTHALVTHTNDDGSVDGANGGVDVTSGPEGGALPAPTSLVSGPSSVHDLHVGADGRVLAVVGNKLFDVGHPGASPIDLAAAGAVAAADFLARATSDGDGHTHALVTHTNDDGSVDIFWATDASGSFTRQHIVSTDAHLAAVQVGLGVDLDGVVYVGVFTETTTTVGTITVYRGAP